MTDMVNHPKHYNSGKYEVIDVIDDWGLNFNLGNALKYIARCDHKGKKREDLEKAIWYLERELSNLPCDKEVESDTQIDFNRFNSYKPKHSATSARETLSMLKQRCEELSNTYL